MWLDEYMVQGNIQQDIANGMDDCVGCVVFITQEYMVATQKSTSSSEFCKFEYDYANQKYFNRTLAVVMETHCLDHATWSGTISGWLGPNLHADFTSDDKLESCYQMIASTLKKWME